MASVCCGSRVTAFKGAQISAPRAPPSVKGVAGAVMRKKGIHPEWYPEAKVICNGQEVMTIGGTKSQYNVDIYSGNHPFYQGNTTMVVMDEGQLNKFKKKFSGLDDVFGVPGETLSQRQAKK